MSFLRNVHLSPFTTFRLGGYAEHFVAVHTKQELEQAISWAQKTKTPYFVIGGGSNILISDKGFSGLIIQNQIKGIEFQEHDGATFVQVGAGETWDDLVACMVKKGLYGLENLSGIPGSVGATPIQNVGAYGTEVAKTISHVEVLNTDVMKYEVFTNSQCMFGYRSSLFKREEGKKYIVTHVEFKLLKTGSLDTSYKDITHYFNTTAIAPSLKSMRDAVLTVRRGKFPDLNTYGCAGSFFRNIVLSESKRAQLKERFPDMPSFGLENGQYKVPLAWILEHVVPWKGVRRKSVGVSDKQPLVLVHYGGGSANEIKKLASDIVFSVSRETGILIIPEVQFVGIF